MISFFKNKYLSDLPYTEDNTRFVIKKIIDLYRRRGSEDGLELFFRLFYDQEIEIYYPAKDMLKPSSSEWKVGTYIQLFPNTDIFSLRQIIGNKIFGSISKAEAVVDKINFFLLNNTLTPVVFLNNVRGTFSAFDEVISIINGDTLFFGKINGSLDGIDIDTNDPDAKTGYKVGDVLDCDCIVGRGAKVIVTDVTENFTGEIRYTVVDGGFGYTEENTLLLVSNQTLFINNTDRIFNILEPLEDQFGNRGIVIGQNDIIVGVKMDSGDEFTANSIIETIDRANNFVVPIIDIVPKNGSSPGLLFPEAVVANTTPEELETSVQAVIDNIEQITVITDIIGNFLDVPLNSSNYNDQPPALASMSGPLTIVDIDTPLNQAFDLTPFEIGRIVRFDNVNPGGGYVNQVFAIAIDPVIDNFERKDQVITLENITAAFTIGEEVTQGSTKGIIRRVFGSTIVVTPFSYYGFNGTDPIVFRNNSFNIVSITNDFTSPLLGKNAIIDVVTEFAVGKVLEVGVINSGFGYVNGSRIRFKDANNVIAAVGTVSARSQGVSEGFWSTFDSHLNIYDGKRLQDSFFYQDYSYQITTELDINNYEETLKDIAHVAGTKVFGRFALSQALDKTSRITIQLEV
jgi:hypothetical protein